MTRTLSLKDEITFGKYEGDTLEDVIVENPNYVRWAVTNVSWFRIDQEAYDLLAMTGKDPTPVNHKFASVFDSLDYGDEADDAWSSFHHFDYMD